MISLEGCVVVVDDDPSISTALERLLQVMGYVCVIFPCAEELLATHTEVNAACLILDVHLPGWTGFELYDYLARMGNVPPVIFITAQDHPEARAKAEAAGAAAYLTKPFSGRELMAVMMQAIHARHAD
jgi:FixJ family two-component response regulator